MEIIRAADMGFCFGVRRAVEMVEAAAQETAPLTTLGSTVHNRQVVERLRERGVEVVANLDEIDGRPVAITAHGVGPQVKEALERLGVPIIDTTCPIVTRSQQWAKRLAGEGFAVVIFGDPEHKEVRGVLGWAGGRGIAIADEADLDRLPEGLPSRIAVLSQTTHTEARFASFVRRLFETRMERISELRVINTLCNATTSQQAAAQELARRVDLMIVIGGHDSANTRHLAELCREEGTQTHHIETAEEIQAQWLAGRERVGVTAGASTPDSAVDEVVARLEETATRMEATPRT
jgi:4-hydroxy-3-methylbut-2-enyl diphosphate reductase